MVIRADTGSARPLNVVLFGGFGAPNVGDELILASLLDFYFKYDSHTRVTVLSSNVAASSSFVEARGSITWIEELNRYFWENVGLDETRVSAVVNELLSIPLSDVFPGIALTVTKALGNADIFHVGGGGSFQGCFPHSVAQVLFCVYFIERVNPTCRIVFSGLMLRPFDQLDGGVQSDLQAIMRDAALVDLRDRRSTQWLEDAGIHHQVSCDDAFLGAWQLSDNAGSASKYCLLHLGGDTKDNMERYERSAAALAGAAEWISQHGLAIVPISFCPIDDDDGRAIEDVMRRAGIDCEVVECSALGVADLLELFRGASLVIGGRLHVAIVAFIACIPVFTVNLTNAFDRIVDLYAGLDCADLDQGQDLASDLIEFLCSHVDIDKAPVGGRLSVLLPALDRKRSALRSVADEILGVSRSPTTVVGH